jgi:hypothetical protein
MEKNSNHTGSIIEQLNDTYIILDEKTLSKLLEISALNTIDDLFYQTIVFLLFLCLVIILISLIAIIQNFIDNFKR